MRVLTALMVCLLALIAIAEGPHHLRHERHHPQAVTEGACAFCAATVAFHGARASAFSVAVPHADFKAFRIVTIRAGARPSPLFQFDPIRPPPFVSL